MKAVHHLTLTTGHVRLSPRAEVEPEVIRRIRGSLWNGSGALWDTGWAVLSLPDRPGGYVYELSFRGVEVARCWLAATDDAADRLWPTAARGHQAAIRPPAPWLVVDLLPDGLVLLAKDPGRIGELGDLERCVAWAVLPDA
jgi:hypothetical protein